MGQPRAASRHPLKGAMPAVRQSRFGSMLGSDIARRIAACQSLASKAIGLGSGHLTGVLRVGAVSHRRAAKWVGRAGS
jgi:hypothetical protein